MCFSRYYRGFQKESFEPTGSDGRGRKHLSILVWKIAVGNELQKKSGSATTRFGFEPFHGLNRERSNLNPSLLRCAALYITPEKSDFDTSIRCPTFFGLVALHFFRVTQS
jgi:hypothetical protein